MEKKAMATVAIGLLISQYDYDGEFVEIKTAKNTAFDERYPFVDKMSVFRFIRE